MFGFKKRAPQPGLREDVERAFAALGELEARIADLESGETMRKLEIEDWYEKFRALYARLNKRAQREEDAAAAPAPTVNPAAMRILGGMR